MASPEELNSPSTAIHELTEGRFTAGKLIVVDPAKAALGEIYELRVKRPDIEDRAVTFAAVDVIVVAEPLSQDQHTALGLQRFGTDYVFEALFRNKDGMLRLLDRPLSDSEKWSADTLIRSIGLTLMSEAIKTGYRKPNQGYLMAKN